MLWGVARKSEWSISLLGCLDTEGLHLYTFAKSGSSEKGIQTERTYRAKEAYAESR